MTVFNYHFTLKYNDNTTTTHKGVYVRANDIHSIRARRAIIDEYRDLEKTLDSVAWYKFTSDFVNTLFIDQGSL